METCRSAILERPHAVGGEGRMKTGVRTELSLVVQLIGLGDALLCFLACLPSCLCLLVVLLVTSQKGFDDEEKDMGMGVWLPRGGACLCECVAVAPHGSRAECKVVADGDFSTTSGQDGQGGVLP